MIKKICVCFILISISFLILFLFVDVTKSSANEINKSFELYTEKDDSYPKGYYPTEEYFTSILITEKDRRFIFSKKICFYPERYSLPYPEGYSLIVKPGGIINPEGTLATKGSEKIKVSNKSRFLKCEDGYMYLEKLDYLEITFTIEYDSMMSSNDFQFTTIENGVEHKLKLKKYSFDESTQEYNFILIWEQLSTDLLYGDTFDVEMSMENNNFFVIPKEYVFFDDEGAYVKKYINTSRYGKLYFKERVNIIEEKIYYYLITGVSLNDTLISSKNIVFS